MPDERRKLAEQFNGCTSNCGSICHYIVDLTDDDFEQTISSLKIIGAVRAAKSLEESRADRLEAIQALARQKDSAADNSLYFQIAKRIDGRSYEGEDWKGWYG